MSIYVSSEHETCMLTEWIDRQLDVRIRTLDSECIIDAANDMPPVRLADKPWLKVLLTDLL